LAVDRRFKRAGEQDTADFFNCTAFGRTAEFIEKYFKKGLKTVVTGRIQNDNYTNKEGQKVYSTVIIVEDAEFAESKNASGAPSTFNGQEGFAAERNAPGIADGFINIPDGVDDDEIPFH
jgi:single-strand DNA-binding protein